MRSAMLILAMGCGSAELPAAEPDASYDASLPAALTSRCTATRERVRCPRQTVLLGSPLAREVHFQTPLGSPPCGGWPVVLFFQGSLVPASRAFDADANAPLGQIHLTRTVKELLDQGYVVLAPEALAGGTTAWQTNIPPWSELWELSADHAFMLELFDALEAGTFGPVDLGQLFAMGISSGGYMTSRMAVSYRGRFRALAIHSASYATCGIVCRIPPLPSDHPPTLFLHGAQDPLVPIEDMERYRDALLSAGHEVVTEVDTSARHEWLRSGPPVIAAWFSSQGSASTPSCP